MCREQRNVQAYSRAAGREQQVLGRSLAPRNALEILLRQSRFRRADGARVPRLLNMVARRGFGQMGCRADLHPDRPRGGNRVPRRRLIESPYLHSGRLHDEYEPRSCPV